MVNDPSHDAHRRPWGRQVAVVLAFGAITAGMVWFERSHAGLQQWLVEESRQGDEGWRAIWTLLSNLGLGETLASILFTVLVVSGSRRRFQDGVVAVLLAGVVSNVVKLLVMRDRPVPSSSFAWPSGHTTAAAALAAALSGWRPAMTASGWLGAVGVAVSRVLRGRHWPGDVCGGMFVGSACGFAAQRVPLLLPEWLEGERARFVIAWLVVAAWALSLADQPAAIGTDVLINTVPALVCGLWAVSRLADGEPLVWPRWRTRLAFTGLFLSVLLIGHAGASAFALLDVDEPRFATASRTMLHTGDWIVPWFNGVERFDKPVLIYWLQAAAMAVFGAFEGAARLPSAFGVALAAVATAGIARLLGLALLPALLAGMVAGTAPLAQALAHGCTADGVLYGIVTAIAWVQVWRCRRGPGFGSWLLLWFGIGLAFLTKGPPALVGPAALGIGLWWAGSRPRWRAFGGGTLLALAIVAAWAVPALVQTNGGFFTRGIMYHVVERSGRPFEGHGGYGPQWLLLYFVTIPLTMLPWSLLLPWAIGALRGRMPQLTNGEDGAAQRRLLLGWVVGVVGTFTLVVSKLPHYVLPCYPALAIALLLGRTGAARPLLAWLGRGIGLALVVALPVAVVSVGLEGALLPAIVSSGCLGGALWVSSRWLARGRTLHAIAGMAMGVGLGMAAWFGRALPTADPDMLARAFAAELPAQVHTGDTLYLYRIVVPSVTFYLDRVTPSADDEPATLRLLTQRGNLVLMRDRERDNLLHAAAALEHEEPALVAAARAVLQTPLWTARGFLPTKGKVVEVQVYGVHADAPDGR